MTGQGGATARLIAAAAAALAVVALAAATAATASAAPAPARVLPEQLEAMTLTRDLIGGARLDALQPSPSSGAMDLADAPRYTLDPKDGPEHLEDAGWVGGFDRSWGPGFAPDGAFFGGSTVHLFEDEPAAALFHASQVESFRRFRGKAIEGGWSLVSTTAWQVPSLGRGAWATRNTFKSKAGTFYDTEIHLRVGRVVGEVGLISSRNTDLRRAIENDGRALLLRIKRVSGSAK